MKVTCQLMYLHDGIIPCIYSLSDNTNIHANGTKLVLTYARS
jgi:hypothetical protein